MEDEEAEEVSIVDFVKFTRAAESLDKSYNGVTFTDIFDTYIYFNSLALAKIIQKRTNKVPFSLQDDCCVSFYEFSRKTGCFDSYRDYALTKKPLLPPLEMNKEKALFPGSDGSVFWVSGNDATSPSEMQLWLNILKPGDDTHQEFKIKQESLLHEFWTVGNSFCKKG